jgi:glucose-1-phosphate adenylyltransferase
VSNCILSSGAIIAGGAVYESVLSRGVHIMRGAEVRQSVLMEGVTIEPGARLNRCIVDKNVTVPSGFWVGWDHESDAERFLVSDKGVVAIPKNHVIEP